MRLCMMSFIIFVSRLSVTYLVNEIKIYTDTDQTFYLKKTWAFVVWTQNLGLDSNPNHNPKTKKTKPQTQIQTQKPK